MEFYLPLLYFLHGLIQQENKRSKTYLQLYNAKMIALDPKERGAPVSEVQRTNYDGEPVESRRDLLEVIHHIMSGRPAPVTIKILTDAPISSGCIHPQLSHPRQPAGYPRDKDSLLHAEFNFHSLIANTMSFFLFICKLKLVLN